MGTRDEGMAFADRCAACAGGLCFDRRPCEEREAVAASWNTVGNTPVLSFGGDSDRPLAEWSEVFETFAADFADLAETEPEGLDEEIAEVQTTIDEMRTFLASEDADPVVDRPALAMLYARLAEVNPLLSELDSACTENAP